ncbi:GlxA family transcriptional regulator [Williamsia sterculiae]|uniref:Transcriptional regulator GlxA family, contains an amidase domain and an AraC-type DNA-binding HTH domain n=1 Tax=Williamsia sterculiae TaxID=1344003 RepID=A0A1N7F5C4_9NOCA|nr:helix-turn-helix domain-containing protein [Williamsia sterculiae]SIR95524.1 Transcriptional regulator GlxA family, contains an amidase domain and an AraC-type DNA-binding HTH domain [Williamsia sterculiae]
MLRKVAVIVQNRVALFEYGVINEVFGIDRTDDGVPPFEFLVCSPTPGVPLDSGNGTSVTAPHPLTAALDADVVAVPAGGIGDPSAFDDDYLETLREVVRRGGRVLTVCTGAFAAAAAGLLDGRRCSTHWRYGTQLAAMYPDVTVDTSVLFVEDGPIITSAGTAAGIDACLHLVREELGPQVANRIARRMVVPPHRDGGQRQYVETPVPDCAGDGFGEVLGWMLENLHVEIAVADLAARAVMSPRTFARRFVDEVGTTPHKWLTEQRVLHARNLLESTSLSIDEVAERVGFGSATLLRHHFGATVGVSPTAYRRRFSCPTDRAAIGRS